MKVQELLEDDSWLTKAFDKVTGFMNSDAPAKQYRQYLKFPELDKNNIDLIRVMRDIKKIRGGA